jgi:hypothetical protein
MCWNAEVSLNTFLFSAFALGLIIYNNAYTKYKIPWLNNVWMYVFIMSMLSMQLVEFFIWRNIDNAYYNHLFSVIAVIVLLIQPAASLMLITNIPLRNTMVFIYLLGAIPFTLYTFPTTSHIRTAVGKGGHLQWKFLSTGPISWVFWLFFFLFSFVYEGIWLLFSFATIMLLIVYINYIHLQTVGSMWCWAVNSFLLGCMAYLLIVLPFYEKAGLC